jgi:hypothetical protein
MKIRMFPLIAPAALAACAEEAPDTYNAITVNQAEQNIQAWNGRTVAVQGWLTEPCGQLSCAIFAEPVRRGQEWPKEPYLSIASETLVKPALEQLAGKQVILRGVLSSQCRSSGVVCFDRGPDIIPVSIRRIVAQRVEEH